MKYPHSSSEEQRQISNGYGAAFKFDPNKNHIEERDSNYLRVLCVK